MAVPKLVPFPKEQSLNSEGWLSEGGPLAILIFASNPKLAIGIMSFKPPGVMGGKALEVSTQLDVITVDDPINGVRQIAVKMKVPGTEIEFSDGDFTARYDPEVYLQSPAVVNCPGDHYTAYLPNGGYLLGWGHVESFDPEEYKKGTVPMGKGKYVSTCRDPNTGLIQVPVYVRPAARVSRGQGV